MLNRPGNILSESEPGPGLREEFGLDRNPGMRLVSLFLLILVPLLIVVGKLATLQAFQSEDFIAGFESRVTETFKPIETTDGRILIDGRELARDVATYELKVHYRWLEEPADGLWLRRRARERLSSEDRSDRKQIDAAEQEVLTERQQMHSRLATAIGMSVEQFAQRRGEVQRRVERIVELVERNRDRRAEEEALAQRQEQSQEADGQNLWGSVWERLRTELTTPPKRRRPEPVEVREEFAYHVITEDLPYEHVAAIVSRSELYPGVDFEMRTERDYPHGSLAAHIVGTRQPVDDDDVARQAADSDDNGSSELKTGDRTGRTGVERSYDRYLKGQRGLERIVSNSAGEIILREVVRQARPGSDIDLAIVEPLQRHAESLLDAATGSSPLKWFPEGSEGWQQQLELAAISESEERSASRPTGGCLIAINVHSGQILCAAAAPRFDLRLLVDHNEQLWQALQRDLRSPMFPRVTSMAVAPGSVFKTLTAIAGLESGTLDPERSVDCRGYLKTPERHRCYIYRHYGIGHNDVSLVDALCKSCNVYFYTVGAEMTAGPLVAWSERLGFGRPTGIDLPFESSGHLPRPAATQTVTLARFEEETADATSNAETEPLEPWYDGDTLGLAIGQSRLSVTPLQIARLMAAVATGGDLPTPRVVRAITSHSSSGQPATSVLVPAQKEHVPISDRTLQYVRAGLEQVVASRGGTGHRTVFLKDISIAGKTGTAETGSGRDHGWFAGYVPAEDPQIAFVAVLEHGGSGGRVAGPLAKGLVEEMLRLGLIIPAITE
ncbi:MAG: penicillin-binding transpeptidase domain-containing protein [Planctomycetota bacterium]|nr:penicillin-binding transpeptidase domain-containing protein [Planctomycetota bacterium]MDA1162553.1 penicillin-binding transpeptidase domain-containing protein [Planctomycetota bacterium]